MKRYDELMDRIVSGGAIGEIELLYISMCMLNMQEMTERDPKEVKHIFGEKGLKIVEIMNMDLN